MKIGYQFLNVFFFVFHIGLILFNLFGWLYRPWRKWNLLTLGLTLFSWVVLGIFYGFGYCFLTDLHWQVREELHYPTQSNSYIHFLLISVLPVSISERAIELLTVIVFFIALTLSVLTNAKDFVRNRNLRR